MVKCARCGKVEVPNEGELCPDCQVEAWKEEVELWEKEEEIARLKKQLEKEDNPIVRVHIKEVIEELEKKLKEKVSKELKETACEVCGLKFESVKEYKKHLFHYKDKRLCGIRLLRIIEKDPTLSWLVYKKWKEEVEK